MLRLKLGMLRILLVVLMTVILLAIASPVSAASSVVGKIGQPSKLVLIDESDHIWVDNGQFSILFIKGTAGYDCILDANTLEPLVYDNRFYLEYQHNPNAWKQRGLPVSVSYKGDAESGYTVIRHYDDYLGTTYDVEYFILPDQPIKITIRLHSGQSDTYRLVWSPSGIVQTDYIEDYRRLDFGEVIFDWTDAYQFATQHNVTTQAKGKKADITFELGVVEAGQEVVIDPSIVGTTTITDVFRYPISRRNYYAEGRHWVFYSDGTDIVYKTSIDGSSWSSATTIATPANASYCSGTMWGTYYDGVYVHYTRSDLPGGTFTIFYRRGIPNADGTVTWSAAEQTVVEPGATYLGYMSVISDDEGYPWFGILTNTQTTEIYKSDTNDGTWSTQAGFPYDPTPDTGYRAYLTPLTGGDVFVALLRSSANDVIGELWDGETDSWQGQETVTTKDPEERDFGCITSEGDIVYFVFLQETEDIYFEERSALGVWSETLVYNGTSIAAYPAICLIGSGDLRIVWQNDPTAKHFYYKERIDGVWDANATDWIDASGDILIGNGNYNISFEENSTVMGIVYLTGAGSPYDIMYEFMGSATSKPTVTNSAADNITAVGADLHGEITSDGGDPVTIVGFEWDTDSGAPYANDWNTAYTADVFEHTFTDMPPETTIYWRAYATNSVGTGYSGELSFGTLLSLPFAPTDFTITKSDIDEVTLTWTTGTYADNTILRVKEDGYPLSVTDGYLVYDGALETATKDGLDLSFGSYYFSAWSENETGYSDESAEGMIGGGMAQMIAVLFIIGISGLAVYAKSQILYIGTFIGLLLFGVQLSETSVIYSVPVFVLAGWMIFKGIVPWVRA